MTTGAEIHHELARASAARRRELVLHLLREPPLDLASRAGERAVLTDADFSAAARETLGGLGAPATDRGGVVCREARLTEATMDRTNWSGADLSGSDLSGSRARLACFNEATMEGVNCERADLVGSSFRKASLGEARFREALLEDADFSDASLRFADFGGAVLEGANLQRADLWGASLDKASCEGACLEGAIFTEGSLAGTNLRGVNLRDADLGRVNLSGADLTDADLRGARLGGAVLRDAVLRNARLEETNLSTCDLTHVHLATAWLERTLLLPEQLGDVVGEERAGDHLSARRAYLSLQHNFETLGNGDGASWAYRRRRRMQKLEDLDKSRREWTAGRRWPAAAAFVNFTSDQAAEWLCDYGESVPRVLTALLLVYLGFAALYGFSGGVLQLGQDGTSAVTRSPADLALFSLLSLASAGEAVGLVPSGRGIQLLMAIETLMGVALTGLLGFVLGNRINR